MKSDAPSLRFEKIINAPVKEVYGVFTRQSGITAWLCNMASIDMKSQTRLYLWWDSGYYACGEFTKVVPEKELIFTWLGREDPGKTRVRVTFKAIEAGTHLVIEHRGMKDTPKWKASFDQIKHGWELALNNLVCILETGQDLRIVNRPMMGINIGDFSPEIAEKIGVPVTQGVLIEATIEGMGAQQYGLQKNDVLVEAEGKSVTGFHSLTSILLAKKAGDKINISFYRGPKKLSGILELSLRPVPDIPATATELAQVCFEIYEQGDQALELALNGVSDVEASFKNTPGDWSAKEVLAHLIHGERDWQFAIQKWLIGEVPSDGTNQDSRVRATVIAYPTVADLLLELKRSEIESVAMLRNLPEDFLAQKFSFWVMAYQQLQFKAHTDEHVAQIKAAVAASRSR